MNDNLIHVDDTHELHYGLPSPYRDGLYTTVDIHLDWGDRIRVLLGGIPVVKIDVLVENKPGQYETQARVFVMRPWRWPWEKPITFVAEREHDGN